MAGRHGRRLMRARHSGSRPGPALSASAARARLFVRARRPSLVRGRPNISVFRQTTNGQLSDGHKKDLAGRPYGRLFDLARNHFMTDGADQARPAGERRRQRANMRASCGTPNQIGSQRRTYDNDNDIKNDNNGRRASNQIKSHQIKTDESLARTWRPRRPATNFKPDHGDGVLVTELAVGRPAGHADG
jgi:hypothetical protein